MGCAVRISASYGQVDKERMTSAWPESGDLHSLADYSAPFSSSIPIFDKR